MGDWPRANGTVTHFGIQVTEWQASMDALDLEWEVHGSVQVPEVPSTIHQHAQGQVRQRKTVSWNPDVEVFLGHAELQHLHRVVAQSSLDFAVENVKAIENTDEHSLLAHFPQNLHPEHPLRHPDLPANDAEMEPEEAEDDMDTLGYEGEESDQVADSPSSSYNSRTQRSWQTIQLFRLRGGFVTLRVRWDTYEALVRDISAATVIPWRQIVYLHQAQAIPPDLDAAHTVPVILHRNGDLRPGEELQFILLDVCFFNAIPAHQSEVVRSVKLMPKQLHRGLLIHFLHLDAYCSRVQHRCLVWRNHVRVPMQDTKLMDLRHGDYLRIGVPPWEDNCAIPTRDLANMAYRRVPNRWLYAQWTRLDHRAARDHMPPYTVRLERNDYTDGQADFLNLLQLAQSRSEGPQDGIDLPPKCPPEEHEWQLDQDQRDLERDSSSSDEDAIQSTLQSLHDAWMDDVRTRPAEEEPAAVFNTYYLHGENHPKCDFSRRVTLGPDPLQWLPTISRLWRDVSDIMEDNFYYFVKPQPPSEDNVAGHILPVQKPVADFASVLVSTKALDTGWRNTAILTRSSQNWYSLILVSGMGPLCFRPWLRHECTVHTGTSIILRTSHAFL